MAKKGQVGIIPIGFVGLSELNNTSSWIMRPGKMRMVFGEPIDASVVEALSEVELRELARERIQALLDS